MFRHTTKQRALDQSTLRANALQHYSKRIDDLNDSPYANTYDRELTQSSANIVQYVITGLCNEATLISRSERQVFTIGIWTSEDGHVLRLCFLQPELVTSH